LRLSRAEATGLRATREAIGSNLSPAALGWKLGGVVATDTVLARAAVLQSPLPVGWASDIARGQTALFPVAAGDLMPGLTGEALGERLRALEERWLRSDLRLTKAELLG
jgi:poly(A) polymerase